MNTYENVLDRVQRVIQCGHRFPCFVGDDAEQGEVLWSVDAKVDARKDTGNEGFVVCSKKKGRK